MKPGKPARNPSGQARKPADHVVSPGGRFTPDDFCEVIAQLPEGCPIVGGQAVAWWATKYAVSAGRNRTAEPITSGDIDFWGSRDDLKQLAHALARKPVFPNEYEMTVWVGAIPLNLQGQKSLAEFLHTVPGLDTNDPNKASIGQEYDCGAVHKLIQVLSPVSLVLAKLHALRHFDQTHRQDELHLKVSLQTSQRFIAHLLRQRAIREALWNCERLLAARQLKPYRKLQAQYKFNVLSAIPVDDIKRAADDPAQPPDDRQRLANFLNLRWERLAEGQGKLGSTFAPA